MEANYEGVADGINQEYGKENEEGGNKDIRGDLDRDYLLACRYPQAGSRLISVFFHRSILSFVIFQISHIVTDRFSSRWEQEVYTINYQ
jgi:hypothetical protein